MLFLSKTLLELSAVSGQHLWELRVCVCGLLTLRPAGLTGGGWLIMQISAGVSWGREVVATGRGAQSGPRWADVCEGQQLSSVL